MGQGSGSGYGSGNGDGDGGQAPKAIEKPKPLTIEELRTQRQKTKLHAWIYALITRFRVSGYEVTADEAKFVRDGKADIRLELAKRSPEVIEKLKAAGFEIVSEKGNVVIGRMAVDKIGSLAELDEVKLVLPQF